MAQDGCCAPAIASHPNQQGGRRDKEGHASHFPSRNAASERHTQIPRVSHCRRNVAARPCTWGWAALFTPSGHVPGWKRGLAAQEEGEHSYRGN